LAYSIIPLTGIKSRETMPLSYIFGGRTGLTNATGDNNPIKNYVLVGGRAGDGGYYESQGRTYQAGG
jgi:hypothetical protein